MDFVKVQANSLEEALEWLDENLDEVPLGDEPEYVDGSYEVDEGDAEDFVFYQKGLTCVSYSCEDLSSLADSILLPHDTLIAESTFCYRAGKVVVELVVQGNVRVTYQGKEYRHVEEFPAELREAFMKGEADTNPDIHIKSRNRFEYRIQGKTGTMCERDLSKATPEDIVEDMRKIAGKNFGLEEDTQ